jgi:hypothetical protein
MELPVISIIISLAGVLFTYFAFVLKQNERITRLEVKNELFWKALENKLADMLKSPTHLDKDILLDKFKDGSLTPEETKILRTILTEEFNNKEKSFALALVISRLETNIAIEDSSHKRSKKCR